MTRLQFWIFTLSSVIVAALFGGEAILAGMARSSGAELARLEQLGEQGPQYSTRWQQIAIHTYQLSQQDPALKQLLDRQDIHIAPKAQQNPAASSSAAKTAPSP